MKRIITIGLDLAKSVFQDHVITENGHVVVRRALRRSQVLEFFRQIEPCLVGIEACGSSHYWANAIGEFGHTVRLMPPAYVKPYVKRNKTDAADAEAICEAVAHPTMRFVPVKSPEERAASMVLETRELFVRQRSQTASAMRAHMAELGIIAATGMTSIAKLIAVLRDDRDERLPNSARTALLEMAEQIEKLTARVEAFDTKIVAAVKADEAARRLTTILGVGPIIATTVCAAVPDPAAFRTGRDLAAWIGVTPRANSSGGRERLGKISTQGNRQLRTRLIVGATSILKQVCRSVRLPAWVVSLIARRPYKVAAVALANKMARTIWALLVKGGVYQPATALVIV
ncbi:IS110 family transposase [Rhizobium rhizogenes]|uniref:IS110 family transposase n=1 Tax=Rhizobium rhizogenes TaxID=359 RepID=UPI00129633FD|nr:IS110 family transposase [Rhizobium rhizogenes]MQB35182.1 IS110 family transposase [Rhizobium rhizogenes]